MAEARLKSGIWVKAVLRQGMLVDKPGILVRKGDSDAGGILVKLYARTGCVVLSRFYDMDAGLSWLRATGPDPVAEAAADAYIARQVGIDPDLWVLEFEVSDYIPPFEGRIV